MLRCLGDVAGPGLCCWAGVRARKSLSLFEWAKQTVDANPRVPRGVPVVEREQRNQVFPSCRSVMSLEGWLRNGVLREPFS
jgi:hypothetical protein